MLRAGALFVAVAISFVIALLISSLIILSFHYKIQNLENLLQKKLERNLQSAMVLLMESSLMTEDQTILDLYGEESDSVKIKKSSWGVFEVANVKSFSGRYSLTRTVFYGYRPNDTLSPALYLADLSRPLTLCGNTRIKGTCYLPKAGVKRGYIEGRGFEGTTLIDGQTKVSKNTLPALDDKIIKKVDLIKKADSLHISVSTTGYKIGNISADSLIHSFEDTTMMVILSSGTISDKYLSGNIILFFSGALVVQPDAQLDNVILLANSIRFKSGFSGNLQAFALDSIVVEENCKLNFPSALGLFKKSYKTQQPYIKFKQGSYLKGVVFTYQPSLITDLQQTLISIESGATVVGQVYADGFADIKGIVKGSVWCNKMLLKTKASVYENHVMNGVIDKTQLSPYYVGTGLIAAGNKKKVIKWID
ncbi:MAG TPA: hypothetical protein VNB90_03320 [Cytophagaceae bacterium]|nr:hypothetical protein [Cytophagaceae bacterium]